MGKKRVVKEDTADIPAQEGPAGSSQDVKKSGGKTTKFSATHFYISASYNNTLISVTDERGNVITWSSAGAIGFKGPKKATPYAASRVIETIFEKLGGVSFGKVSVHVQGVGGGRDAAIRALAARGLDLMALEDTTPIPHNGCRPRKARRV